MLSMHLCTQPCPHSQFLRGGWRVPSPQWTDRRFETGVEQGSAQRHPAAGGRTEAQGLPTGETFAACFFYPFILSFIHSFIHSFNNLPSWLYHRSCRLREESVKVCPQGTPSLMGKQPHN